MKHWLRFRGASRSRSRLLVWSSLLQRHSRQHHQHRSRAARVDDHRSQHQRLHATDVGQLHKIRVSLIIVTHQNFVFLQTPVQICTVSKGLLTYMTVYSTVMFLLYFVVRTPSTVWTRNVTWYPLHQYNLSYLHIAEFSYMGVNYRQNHYAFWREYFPSLSARFPGSKLISQQTQFQSMLMNWLS